MKPENRNKNIKGFLTVRFFKRMLMPQSHPEKVVRSVDELATSQSLESLYQ